MEPVDSYSLRPRPHLSGKPVNPAPVTVTHDEVINMLNVAVCVHRDASPDLFNATSHAAVGAITFAYMLQLITPDEANAFIAQLSAPQKGGAQ